MRGTGPLVSVVVSIDTRTGPFIGPQQTADLPAYRVSDVLISGRIDVLDHPMMPIAVRSGTPRTRSSVAAVCLASCSRPSRTPASFSSAFHLWLSEFGFNGLPMGDVKSHSSSARGPPSHRDQHRHHGPRAG